MQSFAMIGLLKKKRGMSIKLISPDLIGFLMQCKIFFINAKGFVGMVKNKIATLK
jgi:hypothetical protein